MSFYQYFLENYTTDKPLAAAAHIPKGVRVVIHAKHDVGPVKLVLTTTEDTTTQDLITDLKQEDPSIITAVVYLAGDESDELTETSDNRLASYVSAVSEELNKPPTEAKRPQYKMQRSVSIANRARDRLRDRDSMIQPVEEDEQQLTASTNQQPTSPQDAAKQTQIANIDKMIAQRQAQMATLRQNVDRAQRQVQAKQQEIDQLMRQKGAIS